MASRWVAISRYLPVTHPQARVVKLIRRTRLIMAPLRNTTRLVSFATSVPLSCADCVLGIWPNFDSGVRRDVNAAPSVELVTRQVGSESGIEDRKSRIGSGFSEPRSSDLGFPVFDGVEALEIELPLRRRAASRSADVDRQDQMEHSAGDELRRRTAERHRQRVPP